MAANMDAAVGSQTPPPPTEIRTPPAPRLGFHDSWEPFSPRKSARISSQRANNRTPSPRASHRQHPASPRSTKKTTINSDGAMVSPQASPRKRSQPAVDRRRQVSGSLTAEGTAHAAAALGLGSDKATQKSANTSVSHAAGMLPTPSKTPQKPPNQKTAASIQTFARNLFSSEEEPMPSPKKRKAKKYSGVTMESFTAEEEEEPISIFTDSQDRIPEKDESAANPFYGDSTSEPSKRQSKRKVVNIPGEGVQSVDDASGREDGMVYVFRGKKFFRKFSQQDDSQSDDQETTGAEGEAQLAKPLTRASVKPRLLFPTHKPVEEEQEDDEEALTDVEDMDILEGVPQTPRKPEAALLAETPEAPKYAPASPPDTKRTTRSTNKLADKLTPLKVTGRKSPFDSWPRIKDHLNQSSAPKRQGDNLASTSTKRTRA